MVPKITANLAATILGVSVSRVEQLAAANMLPFEQVATSTTRIMRVFQRNDIEAYKQKRDKKAQKQEKAA